MCHLRGELRQTLNTAQGLREREQTRRGEEAPRLLRAAANPERDHAAVREAALAVLHDVLVDELARVRRERAIREVVPGMCRKPGVDDFLDVRGALQCPCNCERVRAVRLHPKVQRLGTALCEPTVVRTRDGADGVLEEAQLIGECCMMRREDERAHNDVRVPVYVFRQTVHDDVCTLQQWGRIEW